jgi:predicted amidohydrolase YtcJ
VAEFLDLIIEGNILTMYDARPRVQAVGVKNGMIAIIGDRSDVEELGGKNTRMLAFEDKTIIPGFIETHMHPVHVGNVLLNVDLASAVSISDILKQLA